MPISRIGFLLACLLLVPPATFGQPKAGGADRTRISAGVSFGALALGGEGDFEGKNNVLGGWLDISFKEWELGTVEVEVSGSQLKKRRREGCPSGDCGGRIVYDNGVSRFVVDPMKGPAPGIRFERNGTIGIAALRQFAASRHVAPHVVIGAGWIRRQVSFVFDDPQFGEQTRRETGWGPIVGVGVDFLPGQFVARLQYRTGVVFEGNARAMGQFRLGAGSRF